MALTLSADGLIEGVRAQFGIGTDGRQSFIALPYLKTETENIPNYLPLAHVTDPFAKQSHPFIALFSCLALLGVADCARAALDERQYTYAATNFRSACSSELSEKLFRKYFEGVGAKESNASGMPFSIAFSSPGNIFSTYYRQPAKCCVSMRDVHLDEAIDRMSRHLGLRNPRSVPMGDRKLIVFKPDYSNRIISIDWSKGPSTSSSVLNICHSVATNTDKFYQSLNN